MANYEVDRGLLRGLIPKGTELDLWIGKCLISVVGFQFLNVRVLGLSVPFHRDFDEVNLRFYVKRIVDGKARRGVVFVKEIVPRRVIAWVANALYGERYVALPMSHDEATIGSSRTITYRWRHHDNWCRLGVTVEGDPYLPDETSEEAFITEHYWGYTAQRDGSTLEYQVQHPRWHVWRGTNPEFVCDVPSLYGREFSPFLRGRPRSCYVADGSAIVVRRGTLLAG